jgi:hypothetical protein
MRLKQTDTFNWIPHPRIFLLKLFAAKSSKIFNPFTFEMHFHRAGDNQLTWIIKKKQSVGLCLWLNTNEKLMTARKSDPIEIKNGFRVGWENRFEKQPVHKIRIHRK